jgi:hypothetical protein
MRKAIRILQFKTEEKMSIRKLLNVELHNFGTIKEIRVNEISGACSMNAREVHTKFW